MRISIEIRLSFGVDVLGALSEKLRSQNNDTLNLYRNFLELDEQFKKEKVNEKEFVSKFLTYLISFSASNFLMIRVLLELKSAIQKGTSLKDSTGGEMNPGPASGATPSSAFGIGGFVDTGGTVGTDEAAKGKVYDEDQYTLPMPQRSNLHVTKSTGSIPTNIPNYKKCNICSSRIPSNAKFCSKCGRRQ